MIVDTSVMVSAVERKDPASITALAALGGPSPWSFTVAAELASGVEAAKLLGLPSADRRMRAATLAAYEQLTERSTVLSLDELVRRFALVTAVCSKRTIRSGQNDRWIIATALTLNTRVLTTDEGMHRAGIEIGQAWNSEPPTLLVGAD